MNVAETIFNIFFPKICLGCKAWGSYLCHKCGKNLRKKPPICPVCTHPSPFGATHSLCKKPYALDGLTSIFAYDGVIKKAIKYIKYRRLTSLVDRLVDLMVYEIKEKRINQYALFWKYILEKKPYVVSIPLYSSRKRKRWFNQSALIAGTFSRKFSLNDASDIIIRVKDTHSQSYLSRKDRLKNIKNAFCMAKNISKLEKITKKGTPIAVILVDDVWTTGATLREAAKVLKRNGILYVWALTIAR